MIRLHQLALSPVEEKVFDEAALKRLCAKKLGVLEGEIQKFCIVKRSIDARRGEVSIVYTVDVSLLHKKQEASIAKHFRLNVAAWQPGDAGKQPLSLMNIKMLPWLKKNVRPVVIGAGPAGLFCALTLALRGAEPIVFERGKPVEERVKSIKLLEKQGFLDEESNILFGEGGAGAYSDGKLTCGLNSPLIQTILQTLVECGAPKDILIAAKPHVGTDELRKVLMEIRKHILSFGGEIRFDCKVNDFIIKNGRIQAIRYQKNGNIDEISVEHLYLAIGHSARDTYQRLYECGVPMTQKPFAVGVRIEHLQTDINRAQYGEMAKYLPPADYKLNVHTPDERGVYTFCMCPGGYVMNASSEKNGINVNGMSFHARDGINSNTALLIGIRTEDYGSDHPLAGIRFQREMERKAFLVSGSLKAPCQRVEDFLSGRETHYFGKVKPSYLPGVVPGKMEDIFPKYVWKNLRYALPLLGNKLRGFDDPDAVLTAPETRSSSPIRILRNEAMESEVHGIYPLGEGAGYAGGIVSAAVDGVKAALGKTNL